MGSELILLDDRLNGFLTHKQKQERTLSTKGIIRYIRMLDKELQGCSTENLEYYSALIGKINEAFETLLRMNSELEPWDDIEFDPEEYNEE